MTEKVKKLRYLQTASPEQRREISKKGGDAISKNKAHMSAIGHKGGTTVSSTPGHMSFIGRKGGFAVSADKAHMVELGRKGAIARRKKKEASTNENGTD